MENFRIIMGTYVIRTVLLLFLGMAAWSDVKKRALGIAFLAAGTAAGIALQLAAGKSEWYEMLLGCATGCILIPAATLSRQAIGYGDAFLLACTGIYLGWAENTALMCCSTLAAALFSIALLVLKKKKGKDTIPFAPFVLAGYVFLLATGV